MLGVYVFFFVAVLHIHFLAVRLTGEVDGRERGKRGREEGMNGERTGKRKV